MKICDKDKDEYAVIKAGIIRETAEQGKNVDQLESTFDSPCHRYFDLELSAKDRIFMKDYYSALEKLTEIYDDVIERKKEVSLGSGFSDLVNFGLNSHIFKFQFLYAELLKRNEITRLLLLLVLQLPKCRLAPSNVKLIEKYTWCENDNAKDYPISDSFCWNISEKDVEELKKLVESKTCGLSNCDCLVKSGGYCLEYLKKYIDMTSRDVGIPDYDPNIYGPLNLSDSVVNIAKAEESETIIENQKSIDAIEDLEAEYSTEIFGEPENEIYPKDWGKGISAGVRKYCGNEEKINPLLIEKFNDYCFGSISTNDNKEEETYYCDFSKMLPNRNKKQVETPTISKETPSAGSSSKIVMEKSVELSSDSSTDTLKELGSLKESVKGSEPTTFLKTPKSLQKLTPSPRKGKKELPPRLKSALNDIEKLKSKSESEIQKQKNLWRNENDKGSLIVDLSSATQNVNLGENSEIIRLCANLEMGKLEDSSGDPGKEEIESKPKKSVSNKKNAQKSVKKKDSKYQKTRKVTIVEEYVKEEKTPKYIKVNFPGALQETSSKLNDPVPSDLKIALEALVYACNNQHDDFMREIYNQIYKKFAFADLNKEQDFLLDKLLKKNWPH